MSAGGALACWRGWKRHGLAVVLRRRERIARLEIENERAKSAAADAAALKEQVASLQQELASAKESLASSTAANAELEAAK